MKGKEMMKEVFHEVGELTMYEIEEEKVNHPAHYTECSLECIHVMKLMFGKTAVMWFCLCNAFKYMWRFKHKNGQEDLQKAGWYLEEASHCVDDEHQKELLKRLDDLWDELTDGDKG